MSCFLLITYIYMKNPKHNTFILHFKRKSAFSIVFNQAERKYLVFLCKNVPKYLFNHLFQVELQKLPEHFGLEKSAAKQAPQQRGIAEETKPISNENS